jgi:DNA-binding transcriptional ArsR family regulator
MVVDTLSTAFAALADPTRRKILDRLRRGPASVSDLVRPFRISQQGISKHVAYLERARLIVKVRQGRQHLCSLRSDPIKEVSQWADGYRRFWEARLDKFEEALKQKQQPANKKSERENEH